jgi:hypothetical protein
VNKLIINAMMTLCVVSSAMSFAAGWSDVWSQFPPKAKNAFAGAWHAGKYTAGIGIIAAASMIALSSRENLDDKLKCSALCIAFWTVPSMLVGSGIGLLSDKKKIGGRARVVGCLGGAGAAMTATGFSAGMLFAGMIDDIVRNKR